MVERCAGILFVTSENKGLFLKRSGSSDHDGFWDLPGGHLRPSETHKQAARRECREEIGECPRGDLIEINRQLSKIDGNDNSFTKEVDYTTYIMQIDNEFIPLLNGEHSEFIWAPLNEHPEPIHPGLAVTLRKMNLDELGIAKLMKQGLIASPQKYSNIWLFDIRITGTGLSYRAGHKEFVWRDKSIYLNDEFLERCYGLPVIFEHPDTNTLNTKEYVERNIGSVFIPYIKGDEVWGIAKVWDEHAARIMKENQLSTSPAVVLSGNDLKIPLNKGEDPILFEGKPRLLDHIAICFKGVWDKGDKSTGVSSITVGDHVMADEDTKAAALEEARRKDAAETEKVDSDRILKNILSCVDSISARMDAFENQEKKAADAAKAKADAEKAAADAEKAKQDAESAVKAKQDADEEETKKKEEKEKADKAKQDAEKAEADAAKAKADAENEIRKRIADVEARLPKQMTDADYAAMADAQVKADRIQLMHGKRANRPLDGESLIAYRRRLANELKEHSPAWKDIDLSVVVGDAAFANVETTIYADAEHAGMNPPAPSEDYLREIVSQDVTGRKISTFVGNPSAWMNQFSSTRRRLAGIRNHS